MESPKTIKIHTKHTRKCNTYIQYIKYIYAPCVYVGQLSISVLTHDSIEMTNKTKPTHLKIFLIHTVPHAIRNSADDSATYFPRGHLPHFYDGLLAVVGRVWRQYQIWTVLQRACR